MSKRSAEALAKGETRLLELRIGDARDALDRFEAAWNRLAEGRKVHPLRVLSLEDLPALARTLTPARWALLENLREKGACSIYELASRLGRNYKNVHTDVSALLKINLLERTKENRVSVAWDVVRAEMRF